MKTHELIVSRRTELGWSQAELATQVGGGVKQQDIMRIEKGLTKTSKYMGSIMRTLGLKFDNVGSPLPSVEPKPLPKREDTDRPIPVYASAEGGDGSMVVISEPVEYAPRPHILPNENDLYGVVVEGNSMAKAYRPGDTAWVHPRYRERRDEPCVFRRFDEETGEVSMTIKWLNDFNNNVWKVEQLNPPKEFELKRSEWPECYRVLGKKNRA